MYEKYQAAKGLLTKHTRTAVLNGRPSIQWEDGVRFSYEREVRSKEEAGAVKRVKVCVDAQTGEKKIEEEVDGTEQIVYEQETGRRISKEQTGVTQSPDGRYRLYTKAFQLMLEDTQTKETIALTKDGEPGKEYGNYVDIYSQITVQREGYKEHPLVLWNPQGTRFLITCADRRKCGTLYTLQSYSDQEENLRPKLWEYPCPFVTDSDEEIPHYTIYVGDVQEKTLKKVEAPDFLYPLFTSEERSWARWMEDGERFWFTWIERGFQKGRMYLGDAKTGTTSMLLEETTDTFLNLGAFGNVDGYGNYLFSNFVTNDLKYVFWQSERSGYAHLYRYDLVKNEDGKLQCAGEGIDLFGAEHSEQIVQKLIRVDEENEKIYFMSNHVAGCSDELYYQLYSVKFDGSELTRLTPEDAVHQIQMGDCGFVDTYSRVDLPPVTVLRWLDGTLVCELERADVSELMKAGYQIPERFTVKAEDGVTDLYGILIYPAEFDPEKTYPVIDYIYGGAQLYNVPREFTWDNGMDREIFGGLQEFAQLGFAGIILDGRGTPGRGMEFHKYSYKNIHGCAGLIDHVACAKELKAKYPFLDMERVGIWGNSGGGYATVSAMFLYPEFYKVGVASSGNYDQRMYEHSWTERYDGLYDKEVYEKGDITRLAGNLKGKLMLAYGAMDDNVSMSQTLRLCDELNQKNKDYDLVVLPRKNHNVPSDLYFIRRKMDFFVRHLLGEEPPEAFSMEED